MPSRTEPERPTTARRGVYLLTHPRSASNLFQTMMSKQPSVESSSYQMFPAAFKTLNSLDGGPFSQRSDEEQKTMCASYQEAFVKLQQDLDAAEAKGTRVFIKEHALVLLGPDKLSASVHPSEDDGRQPFVVGDRAKATHTNPTCLPDEFLLDLQPIFQIRHPGLMFPSMVRTDQKAIPGVKASDLKCAAMLTLRWSRALYDWYDNNTQAVKPRVIDADDIMNSPAAVRKLCVQTGLDPDAVQYKWDTWEEKDPMKATFLSTIRTSNGILPGMDSRNFDIEEERTKWKAEFGDEEGEHLTRLVYAAMPDYEYLLSRRTQAET